MTFRQFLVLYQCSHLDMPVGRSTHATDPINAIISARQDERALMGTCCAACTFVEVRSGQHSPTVRPTDHDWLRNKTSA